MPATATKPAAKPYQAKIGERCKYSSTFSGIVPVQYIGLTTGHGPWGEGTKETWVVTRNTGPFRKGEHITDKSFVTPRKCFHKTGMFTYYSADHEWEQKEAAE